MNDESYIQSLVQLKKDARDTRVKLEKMIENAASYEHEIDALIEIARRNIDVVD